MLRKRLITTLAALALLIVSWIAGAELATAQGHSALVSAASVFGNFR